MIDYTQSPDTECTAGAVWSVRGLYLKSGCACDVWGWGTDTALRTQSVLYRKFAGTATLLPAF